jgi:hypothetical protein
VKPVALSWAGLVRPAQEDSSTESGLTPEHVVPAHHQAKWWAFSMPATESKKEDRRE